jgi:hypothetical protein
MKPPLCTSCGKPLEKVDHYQIEHMTLDQEIYRPTHAGEGLASETDLRCGWCDVPLTLEQRRYFYERWYAIPKELRGETTDLPG